LFVIEKKEKRLLLILLGVEKLLQNESVVAKIVFYNNFKLLKGGRKSLVGVLS